MIKENQILEKEEILEQELPEEEVKTEEIAEVVETTKEEVKIDTIDKGKVKIGINKLKPLLIFVDDSGLKEFLQEKLETHFIPPLKSGNIFSHYSY